MKITFELKVEVDKRSLKALWEKLGMQLDEICGEFCDGKYEIKEIDRKE